MSQQNDLENMFNSDNVFGSIGRNCGVVYVVPEKNFIQTWIYKEVVSAVTPFFILEFISESIERL